MLDNNKMDKDLWRPNYFIGECHIAVDREGQPLTVN